ncbi:hypothetical protein ACF07K_41285, partial [Streptomyces sp. NPDC015350]
AHHGPTTGPDRGPHQATTHRQAPATQQRDSTNPGVHSAARGAAAPGRLRLPAPEVHWDRLLFSIKETVYKSWFPFTQQQLDFDEAIISLETDSTTFTARILPSKWPSPEAGLLQGRWPAKDGLLLSAIAVLGTPGGRTATGRPRQGHAAGNDSLSRKACML